MKKKLLLCTMFAVWMGLPVQAAEADFEFDTYSGRKIITETGR